jgi:hypothetical protein
MDAINTRKYGWIARKISAQSYALRTVTPQSV